MDRISTLNANQLSKELQSYKRYKSNTQKEIKEKVGNTAALRDELHKLENKSVKNKELKKDIKIYNIGGDDYTEEDLIAMITFYKKNNPSKILPVDVLRINETLPNDAVKLILYESDINTIVQYCTTEKYNLICNSNDFWNHIFKRDNIKILSNPENYKDWIEMYKNVLAAQKEAFVLETLPYDMVGGVYDFKINKNFNLH